MTHRASQCPQVLAKKVILKSVEVIHTLAAGRGIPYLVCNSDKYMDARMGVRLCLLYTDIDFRKEVCSMKQQQKLYKLRQDDEREK